MGNGELVMGNYLLPITNSPLVKNYLSFSLDLFSLSHSLVDATYHIESLFW